MDARSRRRASPYAKRDHRGRHLRRERDVQQGTWPRASTTAHASDVAVESTVTALAAPVVGLAATPTGRGYWRVGADGGVLTAGDAQFYGSAAGMAHDTIVAIAATRSGHGYWLTDRQRRGVHLRRRGVPRIDGRPPSEPPDRRHGRDARRQRLLARRERRRHLLVQRAVLRLDRHRCASTGRSSAWPRRRTARATGSSRATAASSRSTHRSTARPDRSASTNRSPAWPPRRTATATRWSRPTAACSASERTARSTDRRSTRARARPRLRSRCRPARSATGLRSPTPAPTRSRRRSAAPQCSPSTVVARPG